MKWSRTILIALYLCFWQYEQYESRGVCLPRQNQEGLLIEPPKSPQPFQIISPWAKTSPELNLEDKKPPQYTNLLVNQPNKPKQPKCFIITLPKDGLRENTIVLVDLTQPADSSTAANDNSKAPPIIRPLNVHVNPFITVIGSNNGSAEETDDQANEDLSHEDTINNVSSSVEVNVEDDFYESDKRSAETEYFDDIEDIIPVKESEDTDRTYNYFYQTTNTTEMSPENTGPVLFPITINVDNTESK